MTADWWWCWRTRNRIPFDLIRWFAVIKGAIEILVLISVHILGFWITVEWVSKTQVEGMKTNGNQGDAEIHLRESLKHKMPTTTWYLCILGFHYYSILSFQDRVLVWTMLKHKEYHPPSSLICPINSFTTLRGTALPNIYPSSAPSSVDNDWEQNKEQERERREMTRNKVIAVSSPVSKKALKKPQSSYIWDDYHQT